MKETQIVLEVSTVLHLAMGKRYRSKGFTGGFLEQNLSGLLKDG